MIPITKPSIRRKEMDAVLSCLVSDRIGPAERQKELVKQLCELIGADRGAALREYRRAVELICDIIGLRSGDAVMISPLGHAELYRSLKERGIEPLFGDVDPDSMTLTAEEAQRGVEEGAKAIFVDEALGYVPDLEGIAASGVPLIEDVSESIGGHDGRRKCGEYGSFIVQRLEEDDIITGGGGTLLCASGRQWSSGLKSHAERLDPTARLSDLNAALASIQLKELENYVSRRQEVYAYLLDALRKSRHHAPVQKGEGEHMPYAFPVYIDGSLKEAQSYARKKGVETRQAFAHCALSSLDAEDEWNGEARKIAMRTLLFPLYPRLSKKEVETIGKVIATLP